MKHLLLAIAASVAVVGLVDLARGGPAAVSADPQGSSGRSEAAAPPPGQTPPDAREPARAAAGSTGQGPSASPPPSVQKEMKRLEADRARAAALKSAAAGHPKEIRYQTDWLTGLIDLEMLDEALALGPTIVEEFPKSAEAFFQLGRALGRDGQFDLARIQFQRAIALDPQSAPAHAWAGRIDLAHGDLRSAEAALRKALAIDHDQREARQSLAEILMRGARYGEAISVLETGGAKDGRRAELTGLRTILGELEKHDGYAMPAGFKGLSVPFKNARGFPPLVKVRVGESLERLLVLDTGSNEMVLTPATARVLGLPTKGSATIKDEDGREYPTPAWVVLEHVSIGNLTVGSVPARVSPGLQYPSEEIGGIIGRDFLRHFRVVVDYPSKTLTLARAEGPPLAGVPFDVMGAILLEGWDGEKPLGKFALDTSSFTPGALDLQFVASKTGLTVFDSTVKKLSEAPYMFSFTMNALKVGGIEYRDFPATAVDLRMMSRALGLRVRGVVGHSMLRGCRLEIDFRNQRLLMQKPAAAPPDAGAAD